MHHVLRSLIGDSEPAGYDLDFALLTTYTLDLEALLRCL